MPLSLPQRKAWSRVWSTLSKMLSAAVWSEADVLWQQLTDIIWGGKSALSSHDAVTWPPTVRATNETAQLIIYSLPLNKSMKTLPAKLLITSPTFENILITMCKNSYHAMLGPKLQSLLYNLPCREGRNYKLLDNFIWSLVRCSPGSCHTQLTSLKLYRRCVYRAKLFRLWLSEQYLVPAKPSEKIHLGAYRWPLIP